MILTMNIKHLQTSGSGSDFGSSEMPFASGLAYYRSIKFNITNNGTININDSVRRKKKIKNLK